MNVYVYQTYISKSKEDMIELRKKAVKWFKRQKKKKIDFLNEDLEAGITYHDVSSIIEHILFIGNEPRCKTEKCWEAFRKLQEFHSHTFYPLLPEGD